MPAVPTADQLDAAAEALGAIDTFLGQRATLLSGGVDRLDGVASGIVDWWTGPRATATTSEVADVVDRIDPAAEPLRSVGERARAMGRRATELARRVRTLDAERADAIRDSLRPAPYDPLFPNPVGLPLFPNPGLTRAREIDRQLDDIDTTWTAEASAAARFIDSTLGTLTRATRADIDTRRLGLPGDPAMLKLLIGLTPGLHAPSPDRDPADVNAWWNSLDGNARQSLMATMPGVIGNLDGIPLTDRSVSIRTYINDLLEREGSHGPVHDRLAPFVGPDGTADPNRKIIALDLTGDGRVAEYFGDFDNADHVAVMVPGMGSTMGNFSSGVAKDAEKLWRLSGPGSAVIAWTGYDAPAGIEQGMRALEVASPRQAEDGGRALHGFIDGLHVQTDAPLTLIGHSYGSLTVGKALSDGAQVTNVVFIGSPGTGVDHVRDFPPGAAEHFYAGEVKGDPVATVQHFGDDPTDDDFGAFVFDAGPGDSANPMSRHSEYFDDGAAIDNLVAISTGGTPTPGTTTPIEHLLEVNEDLHDLGHGGIDLWQDIKHVPFVDDQIDAVVDAGQATADEIRDVGAAVVETGGHMAEDAVGWLHEHHVIDPLGVFGG